MFHINTSGLIFTLAFSLISFIPEIRAQTTDGIAAIVNDDIITFSDVRREVGDAEKAVAQSLLPPEEKTARIRELRLAAINGLIDRRLLIQEFNKREYQMPQNIVEQQIRAIIREQHGGDRTKFNDHLRKQGKTYEQFRKEIEDELKLQAMVHQFIQRRVVVSPKKVEDYYAKNKQEFAPQKQSRLAILFLSRSPRLQQRTDSEGRSTTVDPQKNLAADILQKARKGEDFASLVRIYSEGPNRDNGGDWGWMTPDALRPELSQPAFALRAGEISNIIETEEGYYIIKALEVNNPAAPPLDQIRDQVEQRIQIVEGREIQKELIERLRRNAFIKIL
jgi:parvulin-like peptidyl-prolyl isomerase